MMSQRNEILCSVVCLHYEFVSSDNFHSAALSSLSQGQAACQTCFRQSIMYIRAYWVIIKIHCYTNITWMFVTQQQLNYIILNLIQE